MSTKPSLEETISEALNSQLFLAEFTFPRSTFSAPAGQLELADAVVKLGDTLIVEQIKERTKPEASEEDQRRWFKDKVLGKATKQIRDTLTYLGQFEAIAVANGRGHQFNLAGKHSEIIKIVIYQSPGLPEDCRNVRFHMSKTGGGFIHIVSAYDYLRTFDTLRVPSEVIRYFRYREYALSKFPECANMPEPALVGHFVAQDQDQPPSVDSARSLKALEDDSSAWDLGPILRDFHAKRTTPDENNQYYAILEELAKLRRSAWRSVKERITKSIEKVRDDVFAQPYRIVCLDTQCGFVFVPTEREFSSHPNWDAMRLSAVQNFTLAHKYDQKLDKCVGILVSKAGEYYDILWCLAEFEWEEDASLQKRLDDNFPFRPVSEKVVEGYRFRGD